MYFARDKVTGLLGEIEAGLDAGFAKASAETAGDPLDRVTFFHPVIPDATVQYIDSKTYRGDGDVPRAATKFLSQGRKLMIMYHGFSDGWITPFTTIQYYRALAGLAGGYDQIQEGARLFMVPGLYHCSGGPGPNTFDTLTALENWVEKDTAPEGIVATKYVNDTPAQGVSRTMPLCKFPEMASYSGSGDVNDAASWTCPPNDHSLLKIGPNGIQAGEAAPISYPRKPDQNQR
jgi:feruloyl esterase